MKTAIVIDDDLDSVDVLCEFLELKNIQVLGKGYDGKEAIELYQELLPNLVFLDVMMPNYDGFYALEKIKQINPSSIVIMITADLTDITDSRLKMLHASAIVNKPYDINIIMKTVNELLEKNSPNKV